MIVAALAIYKVRPAILFTETNDFPAELSLQTEFFCQLFVILF